MIASAAELGIGNDHSGIIVLPPGTGEPGDDARPLLGLDPAAPDAVVELDVNPDSGYCFSVRGLARELAASLDREYVDPADWYFVGEVAGDAWPVAPGRPGLRAVLRPPRRRRRPRRPEPVVDAAPPARRRDAARSRSSSTSPTT